MRGGGDVIFLATRPPVPAPLPRGSNPEDAAAARREARAAETAEARRDGGVGTHAVARALQACFPAASDRHVTASTRPSAASSRYELGGDDAPGTWADALCVMADALRDLGSLRTPHLGSSRPLDPASDAVRVVHPLSEHGARRAVFVGVNYASSLEKGGERRRSERLRRREDDCRWMLETLAPRGFDDPDGARVLVDDGHRDGQPTKANILGAMKWLTRKAQPGDSLAFHFSGRTDRSRARAAGEAFHRKGVARDARGAVDAKHRVALLPCDFEDAGAITREELHARLVEPLPRGAKLLVVIDSPDANAADVVETPFAFGAEDVRRGKENSGQDLGKAIRRPVSLRDALDASSAVAETLFAEKANARGREKNGNGARAPTPGGPTPGPPQTGCCVVS